MPKYGPIVPLWRRKARARRLARRAATVPTVPLKTANVSKAISSRSFGGTFGRVPGSDQRVPWGRFLTSTPVPLRDVALCVFAGGGTMATTNASSNFTGGPPVTLYLNSIYHCDGSNNVDGFGMFQGRFRFAKVHAVEIEFEFFTPNIAGVAAPSVIAGLLLRGIGETQTFAGGAISSTSGYLLPALHTGLVPEDGSSSFKVRKTIPICDLAGPTRLQFMNDFWNTKTTITSGSESIPTVWVSMEASVARRDAGAAATVSYQYRLTYHTQFFGRLNDA